MEEEEKFLKILNIVLELSLANSKHHRKARKHEMFENFSIFIHCEFFKRQSYAFSLLFKIFPVQYIHSHLC